MFRAEFSSIEGTITNHELTLMVRQTLMFNACVGLWDNALQSLSAAHHTEIPTEHNLVVSRAFS